MLSFTTKHKDVTEDVMEVVKAGDIHTYTNSDGGIVHLPESAPCTPVAKKGKVEPTLSELQDNIVRLVAEKIKENADNLAGLIKKNADTIETLKESSEFLFKEVQDMKTEIKTVKIASDDHQKRITGLEDRVNEMERYHRRWNLRLYGLPEQEGEDVKQRVIDICKAVIQDPEEDLRSQIDVSHRIGRREDGKTRPVITRFALRSAKEKVWKCAKNSEFLKIKKLKFGEDLTTKDKETRTKLWPQIEEARKQGRRAFFVGARAIIEGH
ncbi:uncharacterized protein si:ch211-196c10.15 [Xyrauchen texanus]|uniref:uncharacterized protein si:ch211-196c10.15 n=1 Tax=Xyrauchen texanus TaxID=154827 RepID=UPI002242AAB2|nr:uncharacterized protein si:ch211-196c10.15 [Xyrauchen texanus]